jgi:4-amino-4-deoxy-L-arabinose transferase-like glycosyltransferase
MFAAFIAFIVYLDRGKWTWLVFSAVLGALGVLSKTPGVLLGPILIAAGLFYTWLAGSKADRRQRFKRLALALLVWGAIAAIAFFLLWPSMWTRPGYALTHITDNLLSVMQFESHPTSGNFWGPTQSDRSPFYYLIAIPFHLTPLSTVGLLAGLGMIVAGFIHRRQQIQSFAAQCWMLWRPLDCGGWPWPFVKVGRPCSNNRRRPFSQTLPLPCCRFRCWRKFSLSASTIPII